MPAVDYNWLMEYLGEFRITDEGDEVNAHGDPYPELDKSGGLAPTTFCEPFQHQQLRFGRKLTTAVCRMVKGKRKHVAADDLAAKRLKLPILTAATVSRIPGRSPPVTKYLC